MATCTPGNPFDRWELTPAETTIISGALQTVGATGERMLKYLTYNDQTNITALSRGGSMILSSERIRIKAFLSRLFIGVTVIGSPPSPPIIVAAYNLFDVPYAQAFYTEQNCIGWTGNEYDYPSLYFNSGESCGRIAQKHIVISNVGRDLVVNCDYIPMVGEGGIFLEFYLLPNGSTGFHPSRSPFYSILNATDRHGMIETALARYLKRKGNYFFGELMKNAQGEWYHQ